MATPIRESLLELSGMTEDNAKKYARQIYRYIGQRLEIDRQGGESFITDPNKLANRYYDWSLVQEAFLNTKVTGAPDKEWTDKMDAWVETHIPPSGRKSGNFPLFKSRQALLAAVRTYRNRFFKRKEELHTTIVFDKLGRDIESILRELNLSDWKVELENNGTWDLFLRALTRRALLHVLGDATIREDFLKQSRDAVRKPSK